VTVLVTGSTGNVGSRVVTQLVGQGVQVLALTRDPSTAQLPERADVVAGQLSDVAATLASRDHRQTAAAPVAVDTGTRKGS